jgi:hypothetical protein
MLFLGRKTASKSLMADKPEEALTTDVSILEDQYSNSVALEMAGGAETLRKMPQPSIGVRGLCGSRECSGTRTLPWRSRTRPIFEGNWGCSTRCIEAMVRAAINREFRETTSLAEDAPHRHRVPLGLVLLAQGWITQSQLQMALESQRAQGGRIGEWLVSQCGIERQQITRGLSAQWGCPMLTAAAFDARTMALVMPRAIADEFGALPLRASGRRLYLGFEDRLDATLALALERMTDLRVESGMLLSEEIRSAKNSLGKAEQVAVMVETLRDMGSLTTRIAILLEQKQPVNARVVRVHQYFWLRLWLENGTMSGIGTLPRSTEDMQDYLFLLAMES